MKKDVRFGTMITVVCALAGGCEAPVVPRNPTWEADVFPILQGQCLHCHGANHTAIPGASRWDFFDLSKCTNMDFEMEPKISVSAGSIRVFVEPQQDTDMDGKPVGKAFRAQMPPLPASLLEDWQLETIQRWAKIGDKEKRRGTRRNNRDPRIIITSELPNDVGDELKVSYRLDDADGDPVIGVLKLGNKKVDLLKSSGEITFTGITGDSGEKLTLSANLCDGWKRVSQDVREIQRQ